MNCENVYTSCNCNQTPSAADCNRNTIIAYGSCNAVLIYNPLFGSGGKVTHTLVAHTKRVNTVRWIRGDSNQEEELISGSSDGTLVVWSLREGHYAPLFLKNDSLNKNRTVNIVDGYYQRGKTIVCSAALDTHSLRIWQREKDDSDFILKQSLLYGTEDNPSLCVGLRIGALPNEDKLIVACALDNSKIEIIIQSEDEKGWISFTKLTGHEDWVRGLDFTNDVNGELLMASCSQDSFIRIWRFSNNKSKNGKVHSFKIILESVLAGHDGWVYSVNWSPTSLQLLSASIDKTMVIWELDTAAGLWLEKVRLGEVGGNTLGFYGGFFSPSGNHVIAYSYHGAFHIWSKNVNELWDPSVTVGGHFGEVVDLAWEPKGDFLYSVSVDQTARIHAPWQRDNLELTWHEIARPQVHGYDLSSLAVISRYKYASGAEEKVVRIFEAPETFVDNFKRLCHKSDTESSNLTNNEAPFIPKGASVPSLGLSNKAVFTHDNLDDILGLGTKNPYPEESHFTVQILKEPPTEETLLQNTLWPEIQKLYGHGYEIISLAASPDEKYLASACKSTKLLHAAIFIWDCTNWQHVQQLISHTLTVVQMQFSPDSKNLLSVSRDRRWSLFSKNTENQFELVATTNKSTSVHTRIIWTCAWTHDSKYFATGSRDGKLVMWTKNSKKDPVELLGQYEQATMTLSFPNESVTSVAFAPDFVDGGYLSAVGFETGMIDVFKIVNLKFEKVLHLSRSIAHHLAVRKLTFRPKFGRAGETKPNEGVVQLSSCSSDYSVRVYDIMF